MQITEEIKAAVYENKQNSELSELIPEQNLVLETSNSAERSVKITHRKTIYEES